MTFGRQGRDSRDTFKGTHILFAGDQSAYDLF